MSQPEQTQPDLSSALPAEQAAAQDISAPAQNLRGDSETAGNDSTAGSGVTVENDSSPDADLTLAEEPAAQADDLGVAGTEQEETAPEESRLSLIAAWVVGTVCVIVFGFSVWSGVGNLIGIPAIAEALDQTMAPIGWTWLILLVALPVLIAGAAFLLGLGRRPWTRVLLLLVGLGVLSAMQLNATHIMPLTQYFL